MLGHDRNSCLVFLRFAARCPQEGDGQLRHFVDFLEIFVASDSNACNGSPEKKTRAELSVSLAIANSALREISNTDEIESAIGLNAFTAASDQFQGDDGLMAATFFRNLIDPHLQ
jgi:hypothetical protein